MKLLLLRLTDSDNSVATLNIYAKYKKDLVSPYISELLHYKTVKDYALLLSQNILFLGLLKIRHNSVYKHVICSLSGPLNIQLVQKLVKLLNLKKNQI